jgi:phosphatidylglycerophosphate synthase
MSPTPAAQPSAPDRRPIRARSHPVWIRCAEALARAGISPNAISIAGMLAAIIAGAALFATRIAPLPWPRALFLIAALLIFIRLLANMLDGMVAVSTGKTSPVGELYNEVPDRISDAAVLIGLGYAAASSPELGLLSAVLAVFVAYVRAAARVAGAPQDYRGPMAKQQRMFTVILSSVYLGLAPTAWQPRLPDNGWSIPIAALWLIIAGCIVTVVRRLIRAAALLNARAGDRAQ